MANIWTAQVDVTMIERLLMTAGNPGICSSEHWLEVNCGSSYAAPVGIAVQINTNTYTQAVDGNYYHWAWGTGIYQEGYENLGALSLPWAERTLKIVVNENTGYTSLYAGGVLKAMVATAVIHQGRKADIQNGWSVRLRTTVVNHASAENVIQAIRGQYQAFTLLRDGVSYFADDFASETAPDEWGISLDNTGIMTLDRDEANSRIYTSSVASGLLSAEATKSAEYRLYLLKGGGIAVMALPTGVQHIVANVGTLKDHRETQAIQIASDTSDLPVGVVEVAGRILAYFDRAGVAKVAISYKDGTEWKAGDVGTVSEFATYTLKHVTQQGRTQYAVLYKSGVLYYSRTTSGLTTGWSTPVLIVGSLASEPAAWIVPQANGSVSCYYQLGSATPTVLSNKRQDGGGVWS